MGNIEVTNKEQRLRKLRILGISILIVIGIFFAFVFNVKYFMKTEIVPTLSLSIPSELNETIVKNDNITSSMTTGNTTENYTSHIFSWTFKWRIYTWEILIPERLIDYFSNLPRPNTNNYVIYTMHPHQIELLGSIHKQLQSISLEKEFSSEDTINFLAKFVGSTQYLEDMCDGQLCEYPKYPLETLYDNGGDCEDKSILLACILKAFNFDVALIENTLEDSGHMMVGISGDDISGQYYIESKGEKYYPIDVTNLGWGIGGVPPKYQKASLRVRCLDSSPVLFYTFNAKNVNYNLEFTIKIENSGNGDATDYYVMVGFDAGNEKLWNAERSDNFNIPCGETVELSLTLRPPYGKHTRTCILIYEDGYLIRRMYSNWYDL
jgi:hypothetical protein